MDFFQWVAAIGVSLGIGFMIGSEATKSPSEVEMFERLVGIRTDRKNEETARAEIESEIANAAELKSR